MFKTNFKGFLILLLTGLFLTFVFAGETQAAFRFISWSDAQDQGEYLPTTSNQAMTLNSSFTVFNGDFSDDGVILSPPSSPNPDSMQNMTIAINGGINNGMFGKTFLVRGNHDNHYTNPQSWADYINSVEGNFLKAQGVGATEYTEMPGSYPNTTYSFDFDNSRFIGVDVPGSSGNITSEQNIFIDSRLTDAEARGLTHAFIFFHGPIYCIGYHCTCTQTIDPNCISSRINAASGLLSIINRHPIVSATFHGHEHNMAWTHISGNRITGVTHEFEQFVTSPSGAGSATYDSNTYLKTNRVDYAYTSATDVRRFAAVDVDGPQFTVSFYAVGSSSPNQVWSKTFAKSGSYSSPTPGPSDLPSPSPETVSPAPAQSPGIYVVSAQVNGSADDAEETVKSKAMSLTSSDLELMTDGTRLQTVGIRFNNVAVPKGATITNAYIEFTANENTWTNPTSLNFSGEASDNAAAFTSTAGSISARPHTLAQILWNDLPVWTTVGAKVQSPDLSALVQEITNRTNWSSGNSLVVIVNGTGHRTATAYDGSTTNAPRIFISYRLDAVVSTPCPVPGDANLDCQVNETDYQIWLNHYNQPTTGGISVGDFNADQKVDGIDYVIWRKNFSG